MELRAGDNPHNDPFAGSKREGEEKNQKRKRERERERKRDR